MRSEDIRLHDLDDMALTKALDAYKCTPKEILRNNEVMELLLPVIRADFKLLASHTMDEQRQPLPISIDVLNGTNDPFVTTNQAEGWQKETSAEFRLHFIDGDHFFLHSARGRVISIVGECCLDKTRGVCHEHSTRR